jgi:hypothetical protein
MYLCFCQTNTQTSRKIEIFNLSADEENLLNLEQEMPNTDSRMTTNFSSLIIPLQHIKSIKLLLRDF